MPHVIGLRRYARATYPVPRFQQTVDARPLVFSDTVTGLVDTNSAAADGVPLLRVNLGDPLGFDVPEQEAGSVLLLQLDGSFQQVGDGDQAQVWPIINGIETAFPRVSRLVNGFPPVSVVQSYIIVLGVGVTTVRFNWRCSGHVLQCDPSHATYPCRIDTWGMIVRTS
jgi:hypothetical protein